MPVLRTIYQGCIDSPGEKRACSSVHGKFKPCAKSSNNRYKTYTVIAHEITRNTLLPHLNFAVYRAYNGPCMPSSPSWSLYELVSHETFLLRVHNSYNISIVNSSCLYNGHMSRFIITYQMDAACRTYLYQLPLLHAIGMEYQHCAR